MKDLYPQHFVHDIRNIIGYQIFRIGRTPDSALEEPFRELVDQDKGYCVIKDLLSTDAFEELHELFRSKIDNESAECRVLVQPGDSDYARILRLFDVSQLDKILHRNPTIEFERISIKEKDVNDHNKRWHPDRFVDCHKMFYFLNDHSLENGTYEYSEGSAKGSFIRYVWEYYTSIRYLLARFSRGLIEKYPILLNKFIAEVVYDRFVMEFPQNTLVISNNRGFHRRGNIQPGNIREQVNFVFYYQ